jgi:hypothetical protein
VAYHAGDVQVRLVACLAVAAQHVDAGEAPAEGEHVRPRREIAKRKAVDHAVELVGLQHRDDRRDAVQHSAARNEVRIRGTAPAGEDVLDADALSGTTERDRDGERDLSVSGER